MVHNKIVGRGGQMEIVIEEGNLYMYIYIELE